MRMQTYRITSAAHIVRCAEHLESLSLQDLASDSSDPGEVLATGGDSLEVVDEDTDVEGLLEPLLGAVEVAHVEVELAEAAQEVGEVR